eukprot:GHRR01008912.1.p1 GENE.GHRR01008912.1~~GHRR01008912.1.p1  ORF type:complete len:1552 (+),score=616.00 GHRR01008912.1:172-4827(+)
MMAAAVCIPASSDLLQAQSNLPASQQSVHEPINFLYGHLHNSIRTELDNLSSWALSLEAGSEQELRHRLLHLRERYHFLEQVYKYHSNVEDEVVYPALDSKVKNVTSAYSVEHQDEEYLFGHLATLLSSALAQTGAERTATIRELICKVEEIHTTLRKHLAKEEAQLLPLLQQHFSHAEQAELVAQFLYCIPLDTVERVLSWLKPMVPLLELQELMQHLRDVIPDRLLLQLLVTWLNPAPRKTAAAAAASADTAAAASSNTSSSAAMAAVPAAGRLVMCPFAAAAKHAGSISCSTASQQTQQASSTAAPVPAAAADQHSRQDWPPLRGIVLFHHSIRGALEVFASEAAALLQQSGASCGQLARLVERHRFLRSVCMFHTLSEEEVMFPEVLRISGLGPNHPARVMAACTACQEEHTSELSLFEELGRLLADVRAFVRRGRTRDVSGMLGQLVDTARRVSSAISAHMLREEQEVLPLLAASLGPAEQRGMVWHTLRAMPLRLLERVLPWLLSKLSVEDAEGMMTNLRLGAPQVDQQLVELLLMWAQRGRWPMPDATLTTTNMQQPTVAASVAVDEAAAGNNVKEAASACNMQLCTLPQQPDGDGHTHCLHGTEAATQVNIAEQQPLKHVPATGLQGSVPAHLVEALCRTDGASPSSRGASSSPTVDYLSLGQPATADDTAQQQQQCWNTHDPCYFSNNTCELHLIRQCSDSSGSPRSKRPRLAGVSDSFGNCSSADVTPTAAAAGVAAQAAAAALSAHVLGAAVGSITCAVHIGHMAQQLQQQQSAYVSNPAQTDKLTPNNTASTASHGAGSVTNPIDHIFQFHKALRRELKQLEADATALEQAVLNCCTQHDHHQQSKEPQQHYLQQAQLQQQRPDTPAGMSSPASAGMLLRRCSLALQQLDGRFQFLWGIYRAHSKAEDEIVFPALESKEALHNVSHAYTLDHEQEEQLFHDLAAIISRLKECTSASEAKDPALQLRRMCAAVRASLETHVRAEEAELWPLFSEHFTIKEQQHLVGVIIGRTGAEVLQALLPWVIGSFSEEEKEAMMGSLREATKNTMFEQWLDAVQSGGSTSSATAPAGNQQQQGLLSEGSGRAPGAAPAAAVGPMSLAAQQMDDLAEIAEYLTAGVADGSSTAADDTSIQQQQQPQLEVSGTVAESTNYVPGWEDIFNINQKQLEAAIRRVSNDPNLEPQRKAYLIQNIMVSRYIVAQQRRLNRAASAAAGAGAGTAMTPHHTAQGYNQQSSAVAAGAGVPAVAAGVAAGGCYVHRHDVMHHHNQQQQQLLQQSSTIPGCAGVLGQPQKTYADPAAGVLGCRHYRCSAQLVAPCCGKVFTCRLCHDEACDHRMDRYTVSDMVCMLCNTRQPVAGACSSCGHSLSAYYCNICHLFDDEPGRNIYHCPFCNVCRRGKGLGVDFFHCMQCNACMSLTLFNSHTCRERAMEGNCPVCHEYLFDSATPIKELPCGHFLHSSCFAEYARYNYTCPICCKSIGDMSVYFQMLDCLLASERRKLPVEYAGRQQAVLCQDCGRVGQAPYHFVYHACPHCRSYNTRLL